MNERKHEIKGITLVALVITIIVLLILAGVSIAMLAGENGILGNTEKAIGKSENAQIQENATLADYENKINIDGSRNNTTAPSPKYSAKVSLEAYSSSENQYTTPSSGYIYSPSFATKNGGFLKIYVDNEIALMNCNSDTTTHYRDSICLPVSANSTVYYESKETIALFGVNEETGYGLYFVPNQ